MPRARATPGAIYHFEIDGQRGEELPVLATTEHHFDRPDLPIVVLVHGALDRARSFRRVVERLADYRVVTYDRRGYGDAVDAEPASGLQDHTADLLAVIGNRRATVVAHSVASHIALLAAIEEPDRVASIGLWEPAAPWMDFWPEKARRSVARIAAAPDSGDVAERGVIAMAGEEAWNRLESRPRCVEDRPDNRRDVAADQSRISPRNTPPDALQRRCSSTTRRATCYRNGASRTRRTNAAS